MTRSTVAILVGATLAFAVPASAHAFLNASDPGQGATVSTPPKAVRLTFSEPVEIRFSIFKVYRLSVSSVTDSRALNAAADALVSQDLLKHGDEASRSDAGVANTTRTSTDIVLRLKDLDPGAYVMMWRVLSVDTHTTQGSFVFVYTPVGSLAGFNRVPGSNSFAPAPIANPLALADGRTGQTPSTGTKWMHLWLPFNPFAAGIIRGDGPTGARSPLQLGLSAPDANGGLDLLLISQPVLSLQAVASPVAFVDARAATLAIDPAVRPDLLALQTAAPDNPSLPANIQVSGVLQYRLFNSPSPPVAGGSNLNGFTPTPVFPTINDGLVETAVTWMFSPTFSLFADLTLENTTGADFSTSDIEEAYLDAHDLFGLPGSGIRLGRDRIKLGFDGLLLDETVFDGGRRDGIEMRLSQLGPVSVLGFVQYALDDGLQLGNWTSSRRVWGVRAEAEVLRGWTVDVSYRADTAADVDAGTCPGIGCNIGSGVSAGIQGTLMPGMNLVVEAATYTQSGDVARWYTEPSLELDLQQLLGLPAQPVLTLWYKNFDPYTLPLDAPLGHLLTPGEFGTFNTNDNLTAVGARLDLSITPALSLFGLAEWGTYKDGGPNYNVYSVGVRYNLTTDFVISLSYNSYQVDGGIVTTSPISGLQLSTAQVYELELTKSF